MRTWLSPAKINLFLHIIGRRPDGYHELQTVFQFLDYYDELDFQVRSDSQIQLSSQIPIENNIILKAAQLLQQVSETTLGADITLHKRIPMGGGLGGGSSNAATTLLALNHLWQLKLPEAKLHELGLKLGADVPVFIKGKAAWAEGIGEKLSPVLLPEPWYVVVLPTQAVSTAEIFSAVELTRNTRPITIQEFLEGETRNDFEPLVRKRYPEIGRAIDWLNQYASARLTGSGSSVFAEVATKKEAEQIVAKIPQPFKAFMAKGLNCSPLLSVASYTQ